MKQPKVLLVSLSPSSDSFGEEGKFRFSIFQRRPFIGLYYLSSALENAGYSSEVLCQHGGNFKLPDLIEKISCQEYLFLGIYIQFIGKEKTIRYISEIKKNLPHIKIIAGGPGYIEYEDFLNAGADIVCAGEAEETIVEVADALSKNSDITSIKGIHYILDEKILSSPKREFIENLDTISFPDWSKTDLSSYYDYYILPSRKPIAPIVSSRGCRLKCSFCSTPNVWRGSYRLRSIPNIMDEIDMLLTEYKVRFIIFQDDMLAMEVGRIEELSRSIIEKNYSDFKWMCILHPLSLGNDSARLMWLMKKAGCVLISFGLQSTNPEILKNIRRSPLEPQALENNIKNASKVGILTAVDFIFGLPGETSETIRESQRYALRTRPDFVNFHTFSFVPGAELDEKYKGCSYSSLNGFTKPELENICRRANLRFYFNPRVLFNTLKLIYKYAPEHLYSFLKDFILNIFNFFK